MRDLGEALRVTVHGLVRGHDLAGEAWLAVHEELLVIDTVRGRLALAVELLDGARYAAGVLELHLQDGDAIALVGDARLESVMRELGRRAYAVPELTRSLRALGARRGVPGAEHDRFFGALLAARRAAEGALSADAVRAAFDPPALRGAIIQRLRELAAERYPADPPERRALEAELLDESASLLAGLDALHDAARALAGSADAERFARWRAWQRALQSVFERADACWLTLSVVLAEGRRSDRARWRWRRSPRSRGGSA